MKKTITIPATFYSLVRKKENRRLPQLAGAGPCACPSGEIYPCILLLKKKGRKATRNERK
ncbi:MAG: hypothetical protein J7L16_02475 [Deltaproteobacteria bacterium]|nr:hypothetical protein [Deltaproteobacteria bacterium]